MSMEHNKAWHILYIEDDEEDYFITRHMLTQSHERKVHFDWAPSYEEGRTKLSADHHKDPKHSGGYDAVLVDYDLGLETGVKLIAEFSRDYAAPLILYTGRGSREVDVEAMEVGATLYLNKNEVTPMLLERSIRYAIELKYKEHSLRETSERLQQELAQRKRVERQLAGMAKSLEVDRSRLSTVLENLPFGVWISDKDGRLVQKNNQADKIWAGDAPLAKNIEEYRSYTAYYADTGKLLQPDDYPAAVALRTGKAVEPVELKIHRFDGTEGTVLVSAAPIYDGNGQLVGGVSVNVDITERKKTEEALQAIVKEATLLARFPDENPNPVGRISETGEVLFRNIRAAATPGWDCEVGQMAPAPLLALVQKALANKVTEYADLPFADKFYSVSVVPFPSERYANFYGMDITGRINIEEALKASQKKLFDVMESMNDGFFALDQDWRYTYINQHALQIARIPLEQMLGKNIWELYPSLTGSDLEQHYQHVMRDRVAAQFIARGTMTGRIYNVHVYPTQDGISVFYTDKTEQIEAEEAMQRYAIELERSNQALQDFASIASHDLQEPLRKITMFGQMLESHLGDQANVEGKDIVHRMIAAAVRMQDMIDALLEYSRITSQVNPFEDVHLSAIAQDVISDLEGRIFQTGGQVVVEPLPVVQADPNMMAHLFQNLIGNGLKYHRDGVAPLVKVSANQLAEDKIEILVADNGIGFDMKNSESIFAPFIRLHGKSNYDGTGIGLAICKKITERHGGSISVTSTVNQGSTFRVVLPVHQE